MLSGAFGLGPLMRPGGGFTGVFIVEGVLLELFDVGFESSFRKILMKNNKI